MANINRNDDESQQQYAVTDNIAGTVTGTSNQFFHAPQELEVQSARLCAESLSGSPTCQFQIQRFVTGAGETQIPLGAALALVAVGTSGPQSYTFSSTSLQAGDQVVATQAGTNAAAAQLQLTLVVKKLQDIVSWDF